MLTVLPNLLKARLTLPKTVLFTAQLSVIVTSYGTRLQQWSSESLLLLSWDHR